MTGDLWRALSDVSGEDVGAIMSTWTLQMGFPVLTVRKVSDTTEDGLVISIQQDRFLADGGRDGRALSQPLLTLLNSFFFLNFREICVVCASDNLRSLGFC